jgi:hypothetical protein
MAAPNYSQPCRIAPTAFNAPMTAYPARRYRGSRAVGLSPSTFLCNLGNGERRMRLALIIFLTDVRFAHRRALFTGKSRRTNVRFIWLLREAPLDAFAFPCSKAASRSCSGHHLCHRIHRTYPNCSSNWPLLHNEHWRVSACF